MLYFPRKISDEQVKVLHQFIKTINFYDVWIVYHMDHGGWNGCWRKF